MSKASGSTGHRRCRSTTIPTTRCRSMPPSWSPMWTTCGQPFSSIPLPSRTRLCFLSENRVLPRPSWSRDTPHAMTLRSTFSRHSISPQPPHLCCTRYCYYIVYIHLLRGTDTVTLLSSLVTRSVHHPKTIVLCQDLVTQILH